MEFSGTLILIGAVLTQLALPPGPSALPVIGNVLQMDKRAPFKTMLKLSDKYGSVMTMYLGPQRTVILLGYDAVKEALVDQADDFSGRGPIPLLFKASKGYGLGVSNGECWQQLQRFTLTTLRDFGMGCKGMEEWIQEESSHLVGCIKKMNGWYRIWKGDCACLVCSVCHIQSYKLIFTHSK
uniref:Uncharacterized protein n=1 Tax=Astatotilapia calliptera TaxID=8154 RepID=A0A3P8QM42_ASTCA